MTPQATYRVVGVRHGGERIKLADRLTLDRAEYVQRVLADLVAFHELVIEAAPLTGHVGSTPTFGNSTYGDSRTLRLSHEVLQSSSR